MKLSNQMKAMLKSWGNVFAASLLTALVVVLGDGSLTVEDLWYVLVAGVIAVAPVIKNYLDPKDTRYGRGSEE